MVCLSVPHSFTPARVRVRGVTLIELMVTVAVAVILMSVAAPAMQSFVAARAASGAADDLWQALRLARSESLKRLAPVTICATNDPNAASPNCHGSDWKSGWLIFVDNDRDVDVGAHEVVLRVGSPTSKVGGLAEDSAAAAVTFEANGLAGGVMKFTVTPRVADTSSSTYTSNVRHVCVTVAGQIQVKKGSGNIC